MFGAEDREEGWRGGSARREWCACACAEYPSASSCFCGEMTPTPSSAPNTHIHTHYSRDRKPLFHRCASTREMSAHGGKLDDLRVLFQHHRPRDRGNCPSGRVLNDRLLSLFCTITCIDLKNDKLCSAELAETPAPPFCVCMHDSTSHSAASRPVRLSLTCLRFSSTQSAYLFIYLSSRGACYINAGGKRALAVCHREGGITLMRI